MINRAEREWAIEFLSDRENSIQSLLSYRAGDWADKALEEIRALKIAIKALQQPPADQWIPVTYRETTEEERECGIEWKYILDCPLPDNDTEILVCTKAGSVWTDTFFNDDGCYLDGGYDLTEIAAWQPLPKPYKGGINYD